MAKLTSSAHVILFADNRLRVKHILERPQWKVREKHMALWNYFLARGIDLLQLGRRPGSVRFSPAQEWRDDDNEVRHVGPAIMSAIAKLCPGAAS